MNGSLAAVIDLAVRANVWLASEQGSAPPELLPHDDTFKYVKTIVATWPSRPGPFRKSAHGTAGWFGALRELGAQHVRVVFGGAFADAGSWCLVSDGSKSISWLARWQVGDREDRDRRIWNISIRGERSNVTARTPDIRLRAFELRTALVELGDFATRHAQQDWAEVMQTAQDQLVADHPTCANYPEMVPAGVLPLERLQLLGAATHGWIFGGMGSWNDNEWTEDVQEYERVTANLWSALTTAIEAAVNP